MRVRGGGGYGVGVGRSSTCHAIHPYTTPRLHLTPINRPNPPTTQPPNRPTRIQAPTHPPSHPPTLCSLKPPTPTTPRHPPRPPGTRPPTCPPADTMLTQMPHPNHNQAPTQAPRHLPTCPHPPTLCSLKCPTRTTTRHPPAHTVPALPPIRHSHRAHPSTHQTLTLCPHFHP